MKRLAFAVLLMGLLTPAFGQSFDSLNVYNGTIPEGNRTFYLAPDGDDANPGTIDEPWATIHYAVLQQLRAGDVLVVRGGVYRPPAPVSIGMDGTSEDPIVIVAYPGEVPIFDFSRVPRARNNHGFRLNGDWWRLIGLTIRYAAHNGIRMDGSNNVLQQITAYENVDTGIHMAGGASYNQVINCDSFRNFDPPEGGNADGFSAKFEVGPGNVYRGCRAWNNSDDGWDFWEAQNVVVIDSSWAFGNGDGEALGAGPQFDGNGNGFKLGGGNNPATRPHVGHVVTNSVAFDNVGGGNSKGFDNNNNWGGFYLANNTAFDNGRNFVFPAVVPGQQATFVNNIAFSPVASTNAQTPPERATVVANSWQLEDEITPSMFANLDKELAKAPRRPDGSLPDVDFLKLVPGTALVDAGLHVGSAFFGAAPDLGAHELQEGAFSSGWMHIGPGTAISEARVYDLPNAERWMIKQSLPEESDVFGDGSYRLEYLSGEMLIRDVLLPAPASRGANYLLRLADITTEGEELIMIAHADAIEPKPAWLDAFVPISGAQVSLVDDGGTHHAMTLHVAPSAMGETIHLGPNSIDGTTDAPMYLVFVGDYVIADTEVPSGPPAVALEPIYPNPVQDRATFAFTLDRPGQVTIRVYDGLGRQVAEPVTGFHTAGSHTSIWNATLHPAGVYFVRLTTADISTTRQIVIAR